MSLAEQPEPSAHQRPVKKKVVSKWLFVVIFGQFIKKANGKSKLFDKQNFGFPLELVFDNK